MTLGRPTIHYTKVYAWKYYVSIDWNPDYINYYSGIGTGIEWFQRQVNTMGDPSARGEG